MGIIFKMRRFMNIFKRRLIVLMVGISAILSATSTSSAFASVNCPKWPASLGKNYALNGHIFNCMPAPRNNAEKNLQKGILDYVNAAVASYHFDMKNKLNAKNVDIVVAYNMTFGMRKVAVIPGSGGERPIGVNESGRSWVFPNTNKIITNPTTVVVPYTLAQWNKLRGAIPISFSSG
jgi:hypothetical protein